MGSLFRQLFQDDIGAVKDDHKAALPPAVGNAGAEYLANQILVNDGVAAFRPAVVRPADVDVAARCPVVHSA